MEKITKISFMRKLKDFDSAIVMSVSDKKIDDVIIALTDIKNINFNRTATFKGLKVVFTFIQDNEAIKSHLNLANTDIFLHNSFYIVVDKYENIDYILVYKISDKKTLDFKTLKLKNLEDEKEKAALVEKEKQDKKDLEFKEYFSHKYFNKDKISKLTAMQLGRLKKALEKQYHYDSGVMTVKKNLEATKIQSKKITDKMGNWNRKHYNKLSSLFEQNKYEAKLKAGKLYNICFDDTFSMEIPKIIYDILIDEFIAEIKLRKG